MKTKSDVAMFAVAVGDVLANAWGENDPVIDKVVCAVAMHDKLVEALQAYRDGQDMQRAEKLACAVFAEIE